MSVITLGAAPRKAQPVMTMMSTVGCAMKITEPGRPPRWKLTHAAEPQPSRDPFGSLDQRASTDPVLGSLTFALDGVIEHLSEEDRQEHLAAGDFIVPTPNGSVGQLRNGHRVAVTGLLHSLRRTRGEDSQITITWVASLAVTCP